MKFQVKDLKFKTNAVGLVLTYFIKDKPESHILWKFLGAADKKQVARLFSNKEFQGKDKQTVVIPSFKKGKILLVGLGEKGKWNLRRLVLTARQIVVLAKQYKVKSLTIAIENLASAGESLEKISQVVTENIVMADYAFTKYKQDKNSNFAISEIIFLTSKLALSSVKQGVKVGMIVGKWVNYARDLGNTPGGDMTPTLLASKVKEISRRENNIKVTILDKKKIAANKMGAILGVAKGSAEEPKFIVMEYQGASKIDKPYVFIGKGVTFDSGGLNLKLDKSMDDMWMDMLGGAAVISALAAIAELKLKVNVVGLVPAVENMPGSASFRPGDLLKTMSGKTIEVLNTDAEGRIILTDALTYAERYKPELVVDIATLTSACMIALGLKTSGLLTPDAELENKLREVGERSGDYVWPLPMWEEYEEEIKGIFGDLQNVGKTKFGDAISAAMFLYQFAKKYSWAHLDIAPTMKVVEGQYLAKGASGVGVRFLVELAKLSEK